MPQGVIQLNPRNSPPLHVSKSRNFEKIFQRPMNVGGGASVPASRAREAPGATSASRGRLPTILLVAAAPCCVLCALCGLRPTPLSVLGNLCGPFRISLRPSAPRPPGSVVKVARELNRKAKNRLRDLLRNSSWKLARRKTLRFHVWNEIRLMRPKFLL